LRLIAVIAGLALLAVLVGRTCFNTQGRVLIAARAPNGVEVYVVQRFLGEPYATGFHCRRPDGVWGWGYVEHEDDFWPASKATFQIDTNLHRIVVFRHGKPLLYYDWQNDEYVLGKRSERVSSGPDIWDPTRTAPAWWSPELLPAQ
jgi:hypothetical protein